MLAYSICGFGDCSPVGLDEKDVNVAMLRGWNFGMQHATK